jgi:hypothetical protein
MNKAEAARCQLGTALHLFLQDKDPVSVHCLACGGGEVAEWLAQTASGENFAAHVRETFPELAATKLRELRNRHWNAFKHASTRDGRDRQDEALFAEFDPDSNEHWLFIGWYDYGLAGLPRPAEAQVLEAWYLAKYPEKTNPEVDVARQRFPQLAGLSRDRQRARLIEVCRKARRNRPLLADALTDARPLILP